MVRTGHRHNDWLHVRDSEHWFRALVKGNGRLGDHGAVGRSDRRACRDGWADLTDADGPARNAIGWEREKGKTMRRFLRFWLSGLAILFFHQLLLTVVSVPIVVFGFITGVGRTGNGTGLGLVIVLLIAFVYVPVAYAWLLSRCFRDPEGVMRSV